MNWKHITEMFCFVSLSDRQISSAPASIGGKLPLEPAHPPASETLIRPEDLEPIEPGSSLQTIRTLRRLRTAQDHFTTSSSVIGAMGDGLASSKSEICHYKWAACKIHEYINMFVL